MSFDGAPTSPRLDLDAFARDLDALRAEAMASLGPDDLTHLRRMERWSRACTALGYATAWVAPNPVSPVLLGVGGVARWAIVAHHVLHKGYDKVPGTPERLTSTGFAKGARRYLDWLDWMLPEAWRIEHNTLHHYHTGETLDPDLVEDNVKVVRDAAWPKAVKYAVVAFYALTWKLTYYAPNTFQIHRRAERCRAEGVPVSAARIATGPERYVSVWNPFDPEGRRFWRDCALPYGLTRFVAIPAVFGILGPWASFSVWSNTVMGEALSNLHSFLIIAPNHAGDDMHRFDDPPRGKGEFYLRQVLGSVNYRTGGDLNDFLQGYLNYQIEHHLWPDLPASAYQRLQPKVKAVCERHGVPYVQQPLLARVKQLLGVMVGDRSMRRGPARERATRDAAEPC